MLLNQWFRSVWVKVFKNGPNKICGRQPLENLKEYCLPKAAYTSSESLKAAFHKFTWPIFEYFAPYVVCDTL